MKKVLALALAASAVLSLSACDLFGGKPAAENTTIEENTTLEEPGLNGSTTATPGNEMLGNETLGNAAGVVDDNSTDGNAAGVAGNTL